VATVRELPDVDALIENQHAPIPKWLERRNVTTVKAAFHRGAGRSVRQLHLGPRPGTQARSRLDERRAATDVDQGDTLTRTDQRRWLPWATADMPTLAAAFNQVGR
jgi:hypothetical protein